MLKIGLVGVVNVKFEFVHLLMRNFADNNSRFLRWSLKLSELDFVVEHRAGSKIVMQML